MKHVHDCTLAALLIFAGCDLKGPTENIRKTSEGINSASDKIKLAAESLSRGLAEIDPLALKHLISTNEALRSKLFDVERRLSGLPSGTPFIILKDRRITVQVVQYTGSFRINAWIDSKQNWFWQDRRFDDKGIQLQIDYGKVVEDFVSSLRTTAAREVKGLPINSDQLVEQLVPQVFFRDRGQIANRFRSQVESTFSRFLKESAVIPSPDAREMDIQTSLLTLGEHTVFFEPIPIAYDSNNRWSLRGRIVSIAPEDKVEVIREFDLDSDKYTNHLNKPLPPVQAFLSVYN